MDAKVGPPFPGFWNDLKVRSVGRGNLTSSFWVQTQMWRDHHTSKCEITDVQQFHIKEGFIFLKTDMCKYLKIEHMMCVVESKEAVDGFRYF